MTGFEQLIRQRSVHKHQQPFPVFRSSRFHRKVCQKQPNPEHVRLDSATLLAQYLVASPGLSDLGSAVAVDGALLELAVAVVVAVAEESQPISATALQAVRPVAAVNRKVSSAGVGVAVDNGAETTAYIGGSVGPEARHLVSVFPTNAMVYQHEHTMPLGPCCHHSWCADQRKQ